MRDTEVWDDILGWHEDIRAHVDGATIEEQDAYILGWLRAHRQTDTY